MTGGACVYIDFEKHHDGSTVANTVEVADDIVVDYDTDGAVLGVEIVGRAQCVHVDGEIVYTH